MEPASRINRIVVVGGGSAGWMAATALKVADASVDVLVIEPSEIPTLGVGEATIPSLRGFLRDLGIAEEELIRTCDASFKLAIEFIDWTGWRKPDRFFHPLGTLPEVDGIPLGQAWLALAREGDSRSLDQSCFPAFRLVMERRSPRQVGAPQYEGEVDYAYHLDADRLGDLLRKRALELGVRLLSDRVEDVRTGPGGEISELLTAKNGRVSGDMYVDCTGFASRLLSRALDEPFVSYSDLLPCDRAVVGNTPSEIMEAWPVTRATAGSAGWTWRIPLRSRTSQGYVFCSRHQSEDQAIDEFRRTTGLTDEPRVLALRVGRSRRVRVQNCVAVGLSAGFVEPLESTGLFLIQRGVELLIEHLHDPVAYNEAMTSTFDFIRDFLVGHYAYSRRRDTPFWAEQSDLARLPPDLSKKLAQLSFDELPPDNYSWLLISAGHGRLPDIDRGPAIDLDVARARLDVQEKFGRQLALQLPLQSDFLSALASRDGAGALQLDPVVTEPGLSDDES